MDMDELVDWVYALVRISIAVLLAIVVIGVVIVGIVTIVTIALGE